VGIAVGFKRRGSGERMSVTGHNKQYNNNNYRLCVKSQRLTQLKETNGRKQQNRLFTTNQKPTIATYKVKDHLNATTHRRINRL